MTRDGALAALAAAGYLAAVVLIVLFWQAHGGVRP